MINDRRQEHGPGKGFEFVGADITANECSVARTLVAVDIIIGGNTFIGHIAAIICQFTAYPGINGRRTLFQV